MNRQILRITLLLFFILLGVSLDRDVSIGYSLDDCPPERCHNVEFIGQIGGAMKTVAVQGHYAYVGKVNDLPSLIFPHPQSRKVGETPIFPSIVQNIRGGRRASMWRMQWTELRVVNITDPDPSRGDGFL